MIIPNIRENILKFTNIKEIIKRLSINDEYGGVYYYVLNKDDTAALYNLQFTPIQFYSFPNTPIQGYQIKKKIVLIAYNAFSDSPKIKVLNFNTYFFKIASIIPGVFPYPSLESLNNTFLVFDIDATENVTFKNLSFIFTTPIDHIFLGAYANNFILKQLLNTVMV